jgi:hypothetical protein
MLRYLCDEALDREGLRDALQNRTDAADGTKKDKQDLFWEDASNFAVRLNISRPLSTCA